MDARQPNPYDDDAFPVLVPPLVTYAPEGEFYDRAVFLLAWRQVGPKAWEGLVTWVVTTRTDAGAVHVKHVEWVPGERLSQVPAESLRDRYGKVPRFKRS
ncbi:hypothetical protein [Nonomuraea wenchangensis]|uniref:Uncharacterized protein n=1 Tax=Nonomuraea wenchangensis TaxID=568860 RepID=A0A1I0LWB2_9ACTN|nr:hypothetical protein [Nonomuraea wenchangensis]SEU46545.1 hypothetical protein SAMN05421811_12772 [Nonomuraea wenchangensis]